MLDDKEFLVTDASFTALDVVFYSKIKTVQALILCQIDCDELENLAEWF